MKFFLFFTFLTITLYASPVEQEQNSLSIQQTTTIVEDENEDFDTEFGDEFEDIQEEELYDPFNGYNRSMTSFNDFFYINILNPVASGYSKVMPQTARRGIDNVFENLFFPIRFVNNILQLKFMNALEETGRFLINSTFGVLGLFDAAAYELKWEAHKEDFGQTLGYWGVGPGPHVVLPFLGPSNIRDAFSKIPDYLLDPTSAYIVEYPRDIPNDFWSSMALRSLYWTNKASLHQGEYENIKKDAMDLYPFLRDIYEQKRLKEIEE